MNNTSRNGLNVFQFESIEFEQCIHGFFSRHGGVSTTPWNSLNHGGTVGDVKENVVENRRRAFDFFDRKVDSIFDVWQVHSTTVICADAPRRLDEPHQKADAIFTNNPDVTLFMRFADCVPIMIYDPRKKVVGIIHAGWKGTVNKIAQEAINVIAEKYGSSPKELVAGIGPSIGPDHYIVGEEVEEMVMENFGDYANQLLQKTNGKIHFDLWKANEHTLRSSGVESIEISRVCTACDTQNWFSHRAENGATGRFGAILALKK